MRTRKGQRRRIALDDAGTGVPQTASQSGSETEIDLNRSQAPDPGLQQIRSEAGAGSQLKQARFIESPQLLPVPGRVSNKDLAEVRWLVPRLPFDPGGELV